MIFSVGKIGSVTHHIVLPINRRNVQHDDLEKVDQKHVPYLYEIETYTFLNQVRLSRGLKNPKIVDQLYQSLRLKRNWIGCAVKSFDAKLAAIKRRVTTIWRPFETATAWPPQGERV